MRFGTWNVRRLCCREGLIMRVVRELSKYKLDIVGVQGVRWDRGGTEPACEYTFFFWKGEQES
jgi:hypothetical protein